MNQLSVHDLIALPPLSFINTAIAEVFNKTLALFSTIMEQGYSLKTELSSVFDGSDDSDPCDASEEGDNVEGDNVTMLVLKTACHGKLVMWWDRLNHLYIR